MWKCLDRRDVKRGRGNKGIYKEGEEEEQEVRIGKTGKDTSTLRFWCPEVLVTEGNLRWLWACSIKNVSGCVSRLMLEPNL